MWFWVTLLLGASMPSWATRGPAIAATLTVSAPIPRCGAGYGAKLPILPEAPGLYKRSEESVSHGSALLLDTIQVVATQMRTRWPEADPIVVGRINQPGGARNEFLMHQDGLDADIGIFTGTGRQASFALEATPTTLDLPRTWDMIRTFFATDRVQWILLDQSLIDALHTWTVAHGELDPAAATRTFPPHGEVTGFMVRATVMHAQGHKNHMHVHMKCTE